MKHIYLTAIALCMCTTMAHAEIYKRIDANGHVTYSSEPLKGAKKLHLEPLPVMPATRTSNEGPRDFPRVDSQTQKNRDSTRRAILQDELNNEEKLLAEARQKLQDAEDTPQVYKGADGKTYRNVAKYEETIKSAREDVQTHEKNIEALKTELSRLR